MQASEFISASSFDREYDLPDLLPVAYIEALFASMGHSVTAAVVRVDGMRYAGRVGLSAEDLAALIEITKDPVDGMLLLATDAGRVAVCPLVHEMERIGLLLVQAAGPGSERLMTRMAPCVATAMNRMIFAGYQNKLTAGLHAHVVVDSYDQLKQKAALLQVSEDKYRRLAENLELEVRRKTREIEATQLRLLRQEKLASIGQLAAGMAHEVNNPIGFVISNLNALEKNFESMTDLIREYEGLVGQLTAPDVGGSLRPGVLQTIDAIDDTRREMEIGYLLEDIGQLIGESMDGAKRVQTIVQNLRDFTHPSVETRESVDLNQCLQSTLAILEHMVPSNVTISTSYRPLPPALCFLREINHAFYHVLHNAVLAVSDGGQIDIQSQMVDDQAEIRISDTGPGIEDAYRSKIFDPFFTTREVGQGTGLGLHTAYQIVKKHGGTIVLGNCVGVGATFVIQLPLLQTGPSGGNDRQAQGEV